MKNPLHSRPWLLVALAFTLLIAGWVVLLTIASRNVPQSVPLESPARGR